MKKSLGAFALIASVMTASTASAGERTITFAVDNMTCASCPYIVKSSMEGSSASQGSPFRSEPKPRP